MMRDQEQKPLSQPKPDQQGLDDAHSRGLSGAPRGRHKDSQDDPEAHQAFVRFLNAKIEHKLSSPIDDEVQVEIANLMRLLAVMRWKVVASHRAQFELAFDQLAADQPNLIIVRSLRFGLAEIKDRSAGGISRILSYLSGDAPLHAVLSGLIVVLVLALVISLVIAEGHRFASIAAKEMEYELPLFEAIRNMPIAQLMLLMHAAFIGSVVSILARLRDFLSIAAFSSLLIFVSVVTRPFVSVMLAILVFVMMKAGVISFLGIDLDSPEGPYLAWGVGFLCGFSERLAQDFVVRAGGAFGESGPLKPNPPR